ncbi:SDR family oxidoreductase [Endothiovibrio diazotrophicus]
MSNILIIGATSAIAEATARRYAARGDRLHLIARNAERLEAIAADLGVRGAAAVTHERLDLNQLELHEGALGRAWEALDTVDVVLIAHGTLPDQARCTADPALAVAEFHTNAVTTLSLLTILANRLEKQGNGTLAVITSVAGERGRQSNYLYGAAKGAVSLLLAGLRNRFGKGAIRVIDIRPGFVDTPMTADFPKGPLWAQPETIAKGIVAAADRGRERVYLPGFWRYIMLIIRNIPEFIFKRMSL